MYNVDRSIKEKAFSGGIGLGFNAGIATGLEFDDDISVGLNYTLFGLYWFTDLDDSFGSNNIGLLETRFKYKKLMGQIGYSFNHRMNRTWNAMLCAWVANDEEDRGSSIGVFLKAENNSTLLHKGGVSKVNAYSIGVILLY